MLVAVSVGAVPAKAAIVASGTVPLENYFIAQGVQGIDITAAGTASVVGSIWINNNAPNAFTLVVTERNGGFLKQGLAAAVPVLGVAGAAVATGTPFSAVCNLIDGAGTGAVWGRTAVFAPVAFAAFVNGSAGTYASSAASTATTDFKIDLNATWVANTTLLAGTYTEVFTISLVAVM